MNEKTMHEAGAEDSSRAQRDIFAVLAKRHEGALLRTASRLCRGNDDQAQDLVQDTLIRAYQAFLSGGLDQSRDARPWLTRILTNLFINDYVRRKKWDAGIDFDTLTASGTTGPPQTRAAPADVPGLALLDRTLDEELEQALTQLPESSRRCVQLVDMDGLEYEEAARVLGIPIGTVRSRLARARMKLHDLLQDFGRRRGYVR